MKKVTKKELVEKANDHEHRLFQIEKALEQHGINWFAEEPKLKVLDQSVFDGLDAQWQFAVMQHNGYVILCNQKPFLSFGGSSWDWNEQNIGAGGGYDATNWQNSLIERKELTGSDLCRAMLARGDKYVSGFGHHHSDAAALDNKFADTVSKHTQCFQSSQNAWDYFVPINNQGEPLTAAEAGL